MGTRQIAIPAFLILFFLVADSDVAVSSSKPIHPSLDMTEQRRTPLQFAEALNPTKFPRRLLVVTGAPVPPRTPLPPAHLLTKPSLLPPALHPASVQGVKAKSPSSRGNTKKKPIGRWTVLGLILGGSVLGIALLALCLLFCYSKPKDRGLAPGKPLLSQPDTTSPADGGNSTYNHCRLVFFEGSGLAFDLEDLLRASAELLGKGTTGTSYKAALDDGTEIVVKRLAKCASSVGQREFEQHMEQIGGGNSCFVNVAPVRAYYCSRDERLVVYDYYRQGSVADLLHGDDQKTEKGGRLLFDWDARLRVALGAARGMAHIHGGDNRDDAEAPQVHGNFKSSNVLLTPDLRGYVSETGLAVLLAEAPTQPPLSPGDGYRAPELHESRNRGKITGGGGGGGRGTAKAIRSQKSDVYSFGVFLLELLTGRPAIETISSGSGTTAVYLVKWVHSVLREEWTAEVFDADLVRSENGADEDELLEMIRIAMACVATEPERRPPMAKIVKDIEELASSRDILGYDDDDARKPPACG